MSFPKPNVSGPETTQFRTPDQNIFLVVSLNKPICKKKHFNQCPAKGVKDIFKGKGELQLEEISPWGCYGSTCELGEKTCTWKVLRKVQAKKEVEILVVGIPTLWGWWGGGGFSGALVALWLQPASVPWIGHSWRHLLLLPPAWLDFGWRRFFATYFFVFLLSWKSEGQLDAFLFDLLVLCQVGYSQKSFLDNCVWWGGVFK